MFATTWAFDIITTRSLLHHVLAERTQLGVRVLSHVRLHLHKRLVVRAPLPRVARERAFRADLRAARLAPHRVPPQRLLRAPPRPPALRVGAPSHVRVLAQRKVGDAPLVVLEKLGGDLVHQRGRGARAAAGHRAHQVVDGARAHGHGDELVQAREAVKVCAAKRARGGRGIGLKADLAIEGGSSGGGSRRISVGGRGWGGMRMGSIFLWWWW